MPKAEECKAPDLHAPEIRVLGPVEVTGVDSTGHGPRMAQLAALLYFRPGRSAGVLCADMDPVSPWSTSTLNARMQGLRSSLGSDSSGNLYVPRRKVGEDPYRIAPGIRCDWTRFLQLVERSLPLGPAGLSDLEKVLTLVRGKPSRTGPRSPLGEAQVELAAVDDARQCTGASAKAQERSRGGNSRSGQRCCTRGAGAARAGDREAKRSSGPT
ncbi:hypothetical protein [Streptomyces sp. NPDC001292]|uniref:hypothetical protein n=1 Tax=Streptomyces sp. NPDC001292 TaxID=3364558 RepID=UPI0036A9FB1A